MGKTSFFSIIICVFNAEKTIANTLDCVYKAEGIEKEVIVIDDASQDRTIEICRKFPVRLISLKKNRGPAYCRNLGANMAKGDILFWLDSDVQFDVDLPEKISIIMQKQPDLAGVGTVSSPYPLNRGFFSKYYALQGHLTTIKLFKNQHTVKSCFICTRCGTLRKKIFKETDGFDEYFRKPSLEDYEFSNRIGAEDNIFYSRDLCNRHFFPDNMFSILRHYFMDSYLLGQLRGTAKIKTVFPFTSDGYVGAIVLFSLVLFVGSFFVAHVFIPAVILHFIALLKKINFLKNLYKFYGIFFVIAGWAFYCFSTIPLGIGFLGGLFVGVCCKRMIDNE